MINKISEIGRMALGSRLRALSESLTENVKSVYEMYGMPLKPKWFPVFYTLSKKGEMSISEIANTIGHSHPSVIQIVKELKKDGIAKTGRDKTDARRTNVYLTELGIDLSEKIEVQYLDVNAAVEDLLDNSVHDLWKALDEIEYAIDQKSLFERVKEKKKERETGLLSIVDYDASYQAIFKSMNQAWIEANFVMEEADHISLDHPDEYIINKGGHILIALYDGVPAGVCALIKMDHELYGYELAKMAVSPKFQGKGIGYFLGNAIVDRAKDLGSNAIYLVSNTKLTPAIRLYKKMGFVEVEGLPSPYDRANIKMELVF